MKKASRKVPVILASPVYAPTVYEGSGSTCVMFDLDLDAKSRCRVAFSPEKLDQMIREAIREVGMTRRKGLLDIWESKRSGPATSFHSLQESHVRTETWPKERHMNGEVQLCNFSRDNSKAAQRLTDLIIKGLNPAEVQLLVVTRGPGKGLLPSETFTWRRHTFKFVKRWPAPWA